MGVRRGIRQSGRGAAEAVLDGAEDALFARTPAPPAGWGAADAASGCAGLRPDRGGAESAGRSGYPQDDSERRRAGFSRSGRGPTLPAVQYHECIVREADRTEPHHAGVGSDRAGREVDSEIGRGEAVGVRGERGLEGYGCQRGRRAIAFGAATRDGEQAAYGDFLVRCVRRELAAPAHRALLYMFVLTSTRWPHKAAMMVASA